jgi:hypothetical protein
VKLFLYAFIFLFAIQTYSQVKSVPDSEDYQKVKSDLFDTGVKITFKDGTELMGYILGIKEDNIFVSVKKVIHKVPLSEVSKIEIDDKYFAGWTLGGFYLGQVVFFSWVGFTDAAPVYWNLDMAFLERGLLSFVSVAAAAVAGGITHMIEGDKTFYFTGSNEEVNAETERLKEFLLVDKPVKNKFQISFESAFVNTTYSKIKSTIERGDDGFGPVTTNLNLMRKIQAVYSVSSNVDIGAAYVFTGEPSFPWQRYKPGEYMVSDLSGYFSYSGHGIYPIFQYNLTNSFPSLFFDVVAGGGPGIAKINNTIYQFESNKFTYHIIDKSIFSGYLFTNIRFRVNPTTLIALSADYVFLPEKKPAIDFLNVKEESFSNFSYGISLMFEL